MLKKIIIFLILLSVYLLLHENISTYLKSSHFILLMNINESELSIWVFKCWTIIIIGFYFYRIWRGVRSSSGWIISLVFFNIIYTLNRYYFTDWLFLPESSDLKFLDLLYLVLGSEVLVIFVCHLNDTMLRYDGPFEDLRSRFKKWAESLQKVEINYNLKVGENKSVFQPGGPLENIKEDHLNRAEFVKRIAAEINKSYFEEAFSIGVIGKWGSGKSSFLNFLKQKIDNKDRVFIEYKPWLGQDSKSITKNFLILYKNKLNQFDNNFSSSIDDYYKSLSDIQGGAIGRLINTYIKITKRSNSVEDEFKRINKLLERLNKQVVIFIDDLDRLDYLEIIEVFKLIRNTANFRNTVFVTALDRAYVTNAIRKFNDYQPNTYLDKIFDYEFVLPEYSKEFIVSSINNFLKGELKVDYSIANNTEESDLYYQFLQNPRDLAKFKSFVFINYVDACRELQINEFLILELIRFRYPQVLNSIYLNENELLINPFIKTHNAIRTLARELPGPELDGPGEIKILKHLKDNELGLTSKFYLNELTIKHIIQCFHYLFSNESNEREIFSAGEDQEPVEINSIRKPEYFHAYFQLSLSTDAFRLLEFTESIEGLNWYGLKDYLFHFKAHQKSNPFNVFRAIRGKLMEWGKLEQSHKNCVNTLLWLESTGVPVPRDLFSKLFKPGSSIYESEEEAKIGAKSYLTSYEEVSHYAVGSIIHSYVTAFLRGESHRIAGLTKENLEALNLKVFKNYLKGKKIFDNEVFKMYYLNYHSIDEETNKVNMNPQVNTALRNFVKKNKDIKTAYFNGLVRSYMTPNTLKQYVFEPFIIQVFKEWREFEIFLNESEYKHKAILQEYYQSFKDNNYDSFTLDKDTVPPKDFVNMQEE